jgi:hypothetical protein
VSEGASDVSWNLLKSLFGVRGESQQQGFPELKWVAAAENPFGVRLLDVRPVTQGMLSVTGNAECSENLASLMADDGARFVGEPPVVPRTISAALRFPIDGQLADGVLFAPRAMEHKWALYFHGSQIIAVRSWLRKVCLTAQVESHEHHAEVVEIRGTFSGAEDEEPEFTGRAFDFLIRSHALGEVYPVPLPATFAGQPGHGALWCMSMFGSRAEFAALDLFERRDPERPLRVQSLLHLAAIRGDLAEIQRHVASGVSFGLRAGDGRIPLIWALGSEGTAAIKCLLDLGAPVDGLSDGGITALMEAVQEGREDAVRLLIKRGADVNAMDSRGFTALHRAAEMGKLDILRALLDGGAASDAEAGGHSARSLAEGRGERAIVELLDQHKTLGC